MAAEELKTNAKKLTDWFHEGVDAYKDGGEMKDCPYEPSSEGGDGAPRTDWLSGFLVAWRITKHGPTVWASENGKETVDETVLADKLGLVQGKTYNRKKIEIRMGTPV
jgi:hypothetical protein